MELDHLCDSPELELIKLLVLNGIESQRTLNEEGSHSSWSIVSIFQAALNQVGSFQAAIVSTLFALEAPCSLVRW